MGFFGDKKKKDEPKAQTYTGPPVAPPAEGKPPEGGTADAANAKDPLAGRTPEEAAKLAAGAPQADGTPSDEEADPPTSLEEFPGGITFKFGPSKWDLATQWAERRYEHETEGIGEHIPLCPQIIAIAMFVGAMFFSVGLKARITSLVRPGDPKFHGKGQAIDFGLSGVPEDLIFKLREALTTLRACNSQWQFEFESKNTDLGRVADHVHCEFDDGSLKPTEQPATKPSSVAATTTNNLTGG